MSEMAKVQRVDRLACGAGQLCQLHSNMRKSYVKHRRQVMGYQCAYAGLKGHASTCWLAWHVHGIQEWLLDDYGKKCGYYEASLDNIEMQGPCSLASHPCTLATLMHIASFVACCYGWSQMVILTHGHLNTIPILGEARLYLACVWLVLEQFLVVEVSTTWPGGLNQLVKL